LSKPTVPASKIMLIQGAPALNTAMASLLQGVRGPRVAILANAPSEIIMGLLRRDGYETWPLGPNPTATFEAAGEELPDIVMMDGTVLQVLLTDVQRQNEEQLRLAREHADRAIELEDRLEEEEKRGEALAQRNAELEGALARAEGTIQGMSELARKTLGAAGPVTGKRVRDSDDRN
jgi:hypothetical protein